MGKIYFKSVQYGGGINAQNAKLHKYTATLTSSQYGWFTFADENGNNLALSGVCTPLMASCISSSNYYISGFIAYDENDCYMFKVYDINDSGYTHGYVGTSLTLTFELEYIEVIPSANIGSYTHYSTSEQVVGTWVDGKPLYQKTYAITVGTTNFDIDITSLNADKVFFDIAGSYKVSSDGNIVYLGYYVSGQDRFSAYYRHTDKCIRVGNVGSDYTGSGYITIRYTKAST